MTTAALASPEPGIAEGRRCTHPGVVGRGSELQGVRWGRLVL